MPVRRLSLYPLSEFGGHRIQSLIFILPGLGGPNGFEILTNLFDVACFEGSKGVVGHPPHPTQVNRKEGTWWTRRIGVESEYTSGHPAAS